MQFTTILYVAGDDHHSLLWPMITAFVIRHNIICGRWWSPQFVVANDHSLCNLPQYYMWQEITTVGCGQWSQPLQFTTIYYMWQVITAYDDVKLVFIYLNTILVPSILNMMIDDDDDDGWWWWWMIKSEFIRIKSESIRINYDFLADFSGF